MALLLANSSLDEHPQCWKMLTPLPTPKMAGYRCDLLSKMSGFGGRERANPFRQASPKKMCHSCRTMYLGEAADTITGGLGARVHL